LPIAANQPVLESSLAQPGSGLGLTVRIPEGMRAVSVSSNAVTGVAGFLYPGSHVDVLVTYRPPDETNPLTQTVLQNVEILSAGQKIEPDPQGKPETVNVVTLLLNPVDAEKLVLATSQGSIQFVLRNGVDTNSTTTPGISIAELMTGKPMWKPGRGVETRISFPHRSGSAAAKRSAMAPPNEIPQIAARLTPASSSAVRT